MPVTGDDSGGREKQNHEDDSIPVLPSTTVEAPVISNKIVVVPPVYRLPKYRPIFKTPWTRVLGRKVDDILSNQLIKKLSLHTLKISKIGHLELTPYAIGGELLFHSSGLGGCDDDGHCADELEWPYNGVDINANGENPDGGE